MQIEKKQRGGGGDQRTLSSSFRVNTSNLPHNSCSNRCVSHYTEHAFSKHISLAHNTDLSCTYATVPKINFRLFYHYYQASNIKHPRYTQSLQNDNTLLYLNLRKGNISCILYNITFINWLTTQLAIFVSWY